VKTCRMNKVLFGILVVGLLCIAHAAEEEPDPAAARSHQPPKPVLPRNPAWYPKYFEGGANIQEKELLDWMFAHGFVDGGLSQNKNLGTSGGGMVYTRDVKRGEEVYAVPIDLLVYSSNPYLSPTSKKVLELFREKFRAPGSVAEDFELTEMGLITMFERRDPQAFFYKYLISVQDPLCPAFYNDQELARFEYPWIKTWRLYFLSDSIRNFRRLMELPEMEVYRAPDQDYEFLWAVSTVLQRSFDWGPDTRREYVMVPYLDMINHKPGIQNNYYYSHGPFTINHPDGTVERKSMARSMVLGVDADYKAGSDINIAYSTSSNNIQLLLQYGFVVPDNQHDYVIITLQEPKDEELSRQVEALGPVISVGLNGVVSSDFIRGVNVLMGGRPEVTIDAYKKVLKFVEADLKKFSTTVGEDIAYLKSHPNVDRPEWSAIAYRIEAKKHLRSIIEHLRKCIDDMESGLTLKEFKSSGDKIDWPSRFIKIMFDNEVSDSDPR